MKNNEFKNAFSKISVSNQLEQKIVNRTINSSKKPIFKRRFALISAIILVVSILSVSLTVVYADDVKEFIKSLSAPKSEHDQVKSIPASFEKSENDTLTTMSYQKIEEMLGFPLLKFPGNNSENIAYSTGLNSDGSIGRIDISAGNYEIEENKWASMSIHILNDYAEEGYVWTFKFDELYTHCDRENIYLSKNLKTEITICYDVDSVTYGEDNTKINTLDFFFIYDNVYYAIFGNNMSEKELKLLIESLTY